MTSSTSSSSESSSLMGSEERCTTELQRSEEAGVAGSGGCGGGGSDMSLMELGVAGSPHSRPGWGSVHPGRTQCCGEDDKVATAQGEIRLYKPDILRASHMASSCGQLDLTWSLP